MESFDSQAIDRNNASIILPDGSIYVAPKAHTWHSLENYFLNCINLLNDFIENNPDGDLSKAVNSIVDFSIEDKLSSLLSSYIKRLALAPNGKAQIVDLELSVEYLKPKQSKDLPPSKVIEDQGGFILHVDGKGLYFKDVLVSALGCHYISNKNRLILTAAPNPGKLFRNYILAGWKIINNPQMVFSDKEHRFVLVYFSELAQFHVDGNLDGSQPNFDLYGDVEGPIRGGK